MAISDLMQEHHKRCDAEFAEAEDALRKGRWADGRALLEVFGRNLAGHFAAEEEIIFPAFEDATGMREGPTRMMRYEHEQMRDVLAQMTAAAAADDGDEFAGSAETLLVLMQQHNAKEENILYPMCDAALADVAEALEPGVSRRLAGDA